MCSFHRQKIRSDMKFWVIKNKLNIVIRFIVGRWDLAWASICLFIWSFCFFYFSLSIKRKGKVIHTNRTCIQKYTRQRASHVRWRFCYDHSYDRLWCIWDKMTVEWQQRDVVYVKKENQTCWITIVIPVNNRNFKDLW